MSVYRRSRTCLAVESDKMVTVNGLLATKIKNHFFEPIFLETDNFWLKS